ncbi:MAG: YfhO family protein [Clostridiales bacterium]|nr:YfhO family protein [Clostridiales bacterium]
MRFKYRRLYNCILAFILTLAIMLGVCFFCKLAPFGQKALASSSEYDISTYINAVLSSKENIFYTFSGSAGEGVFYRLSESILSPSRLIISANIDSFRDLYDLGIILKISLAACFMAAYVNWMMKKDDNAAHRGDLFRNITCIVISSAYALSSVVLTDGLSVTDGILFFPLIVLGIDKIASDKGAQTLVISLALNLAFNWYTGFINLGIAVIWFIFEIVMQITGSKGFVKRGDIKTILARLFRFIVSVVFAVASTTFLWYTAYKLMPNKEVVSTGTLMTCVPDIAILAMGGMALIIFMIFNDCKVQLKIAVGFFTGVFTALMMLLPKLSGLARVDIGTRPVRYVLAFLMVFIFAKMFLTNNIFTRRDLVIQSALAVSVVVLIIQLITGLITPVNKLADTEDYENRNRTVKTLVAAVHDLDKGTYRIGFVSDDCKKVTLISSDNELIYFYDESKKINTNDDLAGALYPYAVKYLISKADLADITGNSAPLGEMGGYKVYANPFHIPMAFLFDGEYFDGVFRNADETERLEMAKASCEHIPKGYTIESGDIKFTLDAAKDEQLFVSIGSDPYLQTTLNGSPVIPKIFMGTFYSIPLKEGTNDISISYQPDFMTNAAIISFVSIIALMLFVFTENFYDMHYPHQ